MSETLRLWSVHLALLGLVMLLALASLGLGVVSSGIMAEMKALFVATDGPLTLIMREIRLPRMLMAILVGVSLGLSGAALQGYLRNPLAEPGVIGISATAALGAVLALQLGLTLLSPIALPLAGLVGAALGVGLILFFAGPGGSALSLILAGVAVSSLAGALTALVLNLSPNPFAASEIVFWMMGSIQDRSLAHVALAAPLMALGWALIASTANGLTALTLGEDVAQSLGVNLRALRLRLIFGVALSVGTATAFAGAIGFVGLVVPHLLRGLIGARPALLLLTASLGGAALLLAGDCAVRLIAPERDLKLGVVMALIGAPFFLQMIYKMRGGAL